MPEPRSWWELDEQPFIVDVAERTRTNVYLSHSDYTVPEMVHEVAGQIPDRVAIESGDDRITFGELVSRANQVANVCSTADSTRTPLRCSWPITASPLRWRSAGCCTRA